MKVVVLCDSQGGITSLASMPEGGPPVSFPSPDPREQQIVIDVQDIREDMPGAEVVTRLLEIRDRQRVDMTKYKFVPK
jgi:hypothetical protein